MITFNRKFKINFRRSGAGFTLLELLISVTLVVVVFVIVVNAVVSALKDNRAEQSGLAAVNNAQQIVRSTVSLIRQTESSATGAYPIIAATNSSLTFYTAKANVAVKARLFLNGSTLQLGLTQPGNPPTYPSNTETISTLLTGIQNGSTPLFQYYDNSYNGTTTSTNPMSTIVLNSIRLVKMTVVYDDNPSVPPAASTIELFAQLRNLKDNY